MGMEKEETATGAVRGMLPPHQVTLIAVISLQPTSLERGWAEGGDGAKESKHIII